MKDKNLENWKEATKKEIEKNLDNTTRLYDQFIQNKLYSDLLENFDADNYFTATQIASIFRVIIDKYNELLQWLERLEQ